MDAIDERTATLSNSVVLPYAETGRLKRPGFDAAPV